MNIVEITLRKLSKKGLPFQLNGVNLSKSYLQGIYTHRKVIREKHHLDFIRVVKSVLRAREVDKLVDLNKLFNKKNEKNEKSIELEELITEAIKDRSIFNKEGQKKIEELGRKLNLYSPRYRFILANIFKNNDQPEKALEQFHLILNNFKNNIFNSSILYNITLLTKINDTRLFLNSYKNEINQLDLKIKNKILIESSRKLNLNKEYNLAIELLENVKVDLGVKSDIFKNLAYSYRGLKKYNLAIQYYKDSIEDITNFREYKKLLLFALECYREEGDIEQIKINIKGVEQTKLLDIKKIYGGSYKLGMAYLFLNEKEKAIKSFEKEIYDSVNFLDKGFKKNYFLKSIIKLVHLYDKDQEKQLKLIEHVSKCPTCLVSFEYVMYLLKFYTKLKLYDCTEYLILNFNLKINV